jgi:hypothetical protein
MPMYIVSLDYDFVAIFDCLHDMRNPLGAAAHVRRFSHNSSTWMIVERFANDSRLLVIQPPPE